MHTNKLIHNKRNLNPVFPNQPARLARHKPQQVNRVDQAESQRPLNQARVLAVNQLPLPLLNPVNKIVLKFQIWKYIIRIWSLVTDWCISHQSCYH
jgi:hypothetical protein